MNRFIILCVSIFLTVSSFAQQSWIVRRPAILLSSYNSSSSILHHLPVGTRLQMLSPQLRNNYYHVQVVSDHCKGWVHRNYIILDSSYVEQQPPDDIMAGNLDSVSIRVVDVDNGLCIIIRLPHSKYVIYDAGGLNNSNGDSTWKKMKEFLPEGTSVELMILSHMDADHIVAAPQAILGYNIKKVIWGGYDRKVDGSNISETVAFRKLKSALRQKQGVTESINLNKLDSVIYPGGDIEISGAHLKLLCGFGKPLDEWRSSDAAERLNEVSIVMKLEYGGNSVLFTGDALGRRKNDPENTCIATEKFLIDHVGNGLQSTVMFSPHHGAENGSSKPFLDQVKPKYIVIPAGHVARFLHPRKSTCLRYLNYVTADHIYRTDRGDDQGQSEWEYMRISGCTDTAGDDDIQIDMRSDSSLHIYYLNPVNTCSVYN